MTQTNGDFTTARASAPARGPLAFLLDLFSSVWFGITLLVILFIYCSIDGFMLFAYSMLGIDGAPLIRTLPGIELTEFEWFHWWPFNLLCGLIALNLIVVTVRRIPLKTINLGVWMIHTGIIVLIIGSVWYFGTKVEGDAPVFRRQATIRVPGMAEPVGLLIRPGNDLTVGRGTNAYHFSVSQITPEWPILSGDDQGEKAYAVFIDVQTPTQAFTRQLLAGYPQYTEDILTTGQRAKVANATPLVDTDLQISLDFAPTTHFHVVDSQALFIRRLGERDWIERPIKRPVRYYEYIASRDEVWLPGDADIPLRKLDVTIPAVAADDPLRDASVHLTGYLPHAMDRGRWIDDGDQLNPVLSATLTTKNSSPASLELVAFDLRRSTTMNGAVAFRWVQTPEQLESVLASGDSEPAHGPHLLVRIPGTDVKIEHDVNALASSDPSLPFTPVPGSDYSFRVKSMVNDLQIPSGEYAGRTISVAVVEVKSPARSFTRWVADLPEITRDFADQTDPSGHQSTELDDGIEMLFHPGSGANRALMVLAAGPGEIGVHVRLKGSSGTVERHQLKLGQPVALSSGDLTLTVDGLMTHARSERRPDIVPRNQRNKDAKDLLSMAKVEVNDGGVTRSVWLPFNQYAFPNDQFAYPGRMFYDTRQVRLSDGQTYELMFARKRVQLPYPVALDDFELEQHAGGYTGSALQIRDYVSRLRFTDGTGWTEPMKIHVNGPTEFGGYWYFQSQWDPPAPQMSSAGFNYTGLGVGNRNGVHVQLAGCAIAVAGMIYAFYVKPIIKRRRQLAVRAGVPAERANIGSAKRAVRELEGQPV